MSSTTEEKKTTKKHPFKPRNRRVHQGNNVAFWRMYEGLSQQELADKMQKSQQYVSKKEQQETLEPEDVTLFAEALGIDPQYITDWSNENGGTYIFNIDKMGEGEGSTNMVGTNNFETNHEVHVYPMDKMCEVYDRWLAEKNELIGDYKNQVSQLTQTLDTFTNQVGRFTSVLESFEERLKKLESK